MPFVNSTLFLGFVYNGSCLLWFETKNKSRCIDAQKYAFTQRNLPESEKHILIIQNVHANFRFILASRDNWVSCNQTLCCLRLNGDGRVSSVQPRNNANEIAAAWLAVVVVFLYHILK